MISTAQIAHVASVIITASKETQIAGFFFVFIFVVLICLGLEFALACLSFVMAVTYFINTDVSSLTFFN